MSKIFIVASQKNVADRVPHVVILGSYNTLEDAEDSIDSHSRLLAMNQSDAINVYSVVLSDALLKSYTKSDLADGIQVAKDEDILLQQFGATDVDATNIQKIFEDRLHEKMMRDRRKRRDKEDLVKSTEIPSSVVVTTPSTTFPISTSEESTSFDNDENADAGIRSLTRLSGFRK